MPLFRRGAGPDQEAARAAQAEQQASVEALARGGLPARAAERLQVAAGVFTSSFSVDEFALAGLEGFRPVAQVMGSSVYHVGWQRKPGGGWGWQAVSQELTVLSEAWNEARRLAFGRLEEEATLAGGEAVVGLQLRTGAHDWLAGAVEYVVFGTAVRRDGQRAAPPVLTNLSAQEYRLLSKAGYRPAGLFGASGVFYVVSGWQQQQA